MGMSRAKTQINEIDQQAADWFVLVSDSQVEEDQLVAFMDWLNKSAEHEAAYERTEHMWASLDSVESDFSLIDRGHVDRPIHQGESGYGNLKYWGASMVASLLFVVVGYFSFVPDTNYGEMNIQTAVGVQKPLRLADQSEIILNTNSAARVVYTDDVRRVYLDRGEAYFNVSKQPDWPFVVVVGGSEIKALGTAFNVRLLEDEQVFVSLAEGRVAVVPVLGTPESILLPGQQAQYSSGNNFVQLQKVDLESITEWRSGQLSFVGMALEDVIPEINRYTSTPLVLSDESIGKEVVDAYFQIDNLNNFLIGLDQLFGVESAHRGNRIFLTKRKQAD